MDGPAQELADLGFRRDLASGAANILGALSVALWAGVLNVSVVLTPLAAVVTAGALWRAFAWMRYSRALRRCFKAHRHALALPWAARFDPHRNLTARGYVLRQTPTRDPLFRLMVRLPVPVFLGLGALLLVGRLWVAMHP